MGKYTIECNGIVAEVDFLITLDGQEILAASLFHAGENAKLLGAKFSFSNNFLIKELGSGRVERCHSSGLYRGSVWSFYGDNRYQKLYKQFVYSEQFVRDRIVLCEDGEEDLQVYTYLMENYDLPIQIEWIPALKGKLMQEGEIVKKSGAYSGPISGFRKSGAFLLCSDTADRRIKFGNKMVWLSKLELLAFSKIESGKLVGYIQELIADESIYISDYPQKLFHCESMDEFVNAGRSDELLAMVWQAIKPSSGIDGTLHGAAVLGKSPYAQQAARINACVNYLQHGNKSILFLMEMGVGKTLLSIVSAEAYMVTRWLKANPKMTLYDAYKDGSVKYRQLVCCPSHLAEKWAEEIRQIVPFADVHFIEDYEDAARLHRKGKKPSGKEWYIVKMDKIKLGYSLEPIPTLVKARRQVKIVCRTCRESGVESFRKPGKNTCDGCGGSDWVREPYGAFQEGMICPDCGELLWNSSENRPMRPADFRSQTDNNVRCSVCNAFLWGADCNPAGQNRDAYLSRKKWYRVQHYTNFARKNRGSYLVLRGWEADLYNALQGTKAGRNVPFKSPGDITLSDFSPVRRANAAQFMKSHMKRWFDVCILDEVHTMEGATGRGNVATCLVNASKKVIGLTGSISNGKASSLFRILWTLNPRKMQKLGFTYSNQKEFVERYGTLETRFRMDQDEYERTGHIVRINSGSREEAREAPGTSPLLFVDGVLDMSLMLSLSDFGNVLPNLKEQVVQVSMLPEQKAAYDSLMGKYSMIIKENMALGSKILSAYLQDGLFFPDKPFGTRPLMDPTQDNTVLFERPSLPSDRLYPKEERLCSLVRSELSEGRRCFIYLENTGKDTSGETEENRLMDRIASLLVEQGVVESGHVCMIESVSPGAQAREKWMRKKAEEEGIEVFLVNPRCVETGLDFIWTGEDGKTYNFPTIIFYQMGQRLSTLIQASRRSYRLIQREECRVYYMAYEETLQLSTLQLMAKKMVGAAAVQGKFSSGALAAMAEGVDTKLLLAKALKEKSFGNGAETQAMFNMLDRKDDVSFYDQFPIAPTYYELMGLTEGEQAEQAILEADEEEAGGGLFDLLLEEADETAADEQAGQQAAVVEEEDEDGSAMAFLRNFGFFGFADEDEDDEEGEDLLSVILMPTAPSKKKSRKRVALL